jgi:hypothetical protein
MMFLKVLGACVCCLIVVMLAGGLATSHRTQDARPTGLSPALRNQLIRSDTAQAVRECGRQLGLRDHPATRLTPLDIALMDGCLTPKVQEIMYHYAR